MAFQSTPSIWDSQQEDTNQVEDNHMVAHKQAEGHTQQEVG